MTIDAHRETLRTRLAMANGEHLLTDALWAAVSDPQPWTRPPELPDQEQLYRAQPFTGHHPLPAHLEGRLARLAYRAAAPRHLAAAVRWGRLAPAQVEEVARMAAFDFDEVLGLVLDGAGKQLAWMPSSYGFGDLLPLVRGRPELVLALAEGQRNLGVSARLVALRLLPLVQVDAEQRAHALRQAALASAKEIRAEAQPLAAELDGHEAWLMSHLRGGRAAVREAAAEWCGRAQLASAVEPLIAAARKERSEGTLVVQLRALEQLGTTPSEVFTREDLAARMAKAAKRGTLPPRFAERELPTLPLPRWSDGEEVDRELFTSWLKTAHKRKKADPTPVLEVMTRGLEPEGAAECARSLFRAWEGRDRDAMDKWGQLIDKTDSGTANRGMLALVAVLGDESLVPMGRAYLDEWYGWRSAQCKAVVTMWAHMHSPEATQAALAVATRFRTRGIKKHAQKEVEALAARNGWTPAELADRTLESCGLDERGELALVYTDPDGHPNRQLTAVIADDLSLRVRTEDGKALKSVPGARVGDDEASAKAAKKAFSAAKRAIKRFVTAQNARLEAAMVTQRTWTPELFGLLLDHPVMGKLCERLVWMDDAGRSFRPAEDHSLVDLDDAELTLPDDAAVRLAHGLLLDAGSRQAWSTHLADYEIVQPFAQFGRPLWNPSDADLTGSQFDDLKGIEMSGYDIRRHARKLGYDLDPAADGGYVLGLTREFAEVGLSVHLEVEDLRQPIDETPATLGTVTVRQGDGVLPLSAIPAVLRSEIKADLHALRDASG